MKHLFSILLLALLVLPAAAQKHHSAIDYPELPDFDTPEAQRFELDNGMVLFLIEDRALPMVNVVARVGTGSVYEPGDKVGLASILGQVMRSGGTETVPGDTLNVILENIAASVETSVGATSGGGSMFALTEHAGTVLPLFADVLMNPALPQDKIDLAKTQISSAISRRNDDPGQIASREFNEILYGSESPWARAPEYATVDAISRDDLVAFHEAWYHPGNVMIGAWGDFDAEEMAARIEAAFESWQPVPGFQRPPAPVAQSPDQDGVFLVDKDDVTQSTVYLGHLGDIRADHPDQPALTMMNQVLSGGFSGRLMQSVRVEQGLAYAVGGGYSANFDRPGTFFAQVMTKSESTVDAANAVLAEIDKMREAPPEEEEVALARDGYLNRFVFNFDTRGEVVNRMMTYDWYGYPMDFLEIQKSGLEAVTPQDIHRVSQQYLKPEDIRILVVGKAEEFGAPLTELGPVTEVDISIPTGEEPVEEATEESAEGGVALLMAAREAMGGDPGFGTLEAILMDGSQKISTPDGQTFDLGLKMIIGMPDNVRLEQQTPMGGLVLTKMGDEFGFPAMIPEQMQGQLRDQIRVSMWQSPAYFLSRIDALEAQQLADGELDGRAAKVVLVSPPDGVNQFRLYLDAGTNLPIGITYQQGPVAVSEVYGDYRDTGALHLPYSVKQYQGDQLGGEISYNSIEVNPPVDASTFQQ
ncbi:MAG: insulinase family protein [Rhodothermales bacterium]|nr:insulinase family protein [Rhodothermales bacterium]MBO6780207.1 insulinase family protein [Rhodothermales bacterium]